MSHIPARISTPWVQTDWTARTERNSAGEVAMLGQRTTFLLICSLLLSVHALEMERLHPQRVRLSQTGIDAYLQTDRDLFVHLPVDFDQQPARRYPVLICFDGESALTKTPGEDTSYALDIDLVHDRLLAEALIHPTLIVAIPNAQPNRRWYELRAQRDGDDGELQQTHAFIHERLLPLLRKHFRLADGWQAVGLQGCSMGGHAAAWLISEHPDVYGFMASVSGSAPRLDFLSKLPEDGGAFGSHKLFLDWGAEEGMFWPNNNHIPALRQLLARGWQQGVDLAWRLNQGGHKYRDWRHGIRPMWLLWQGVETPAASDLQLHTWMDATATTSEPGSAGEYARIVARVRDARGLEYHLIDPDLQLDDAKLAAFSDREPGMPWCRQAGDTTARLQAHGLEASLRLQCYEPEQQREVCQLPAAPATGIAIDGLVDEWDGLMNLAQDEAGFRLGACQRDGVLYVAVDYEDDHIIAEDGTAPWQQDGVEIRVDHRPAPRVDLSRGMDERFYLYLAALSPTPDGVDPITPRGGLHDAITARCRIRPGGWSCEAAFAHPRPEIGQEDWTTLRLNVLVNDLDQPGGQLLRLPWRPDWRSDRNQVGSGVLRRSTR